MAHAFIQHTSASLTINENADPDVRRDMETYLSRITPEVKPPQALPASAAPSAPLARPPIPRPLRIPFCSKKQTVCD